MWTASGGREDREEEEEVEGGAVPIIADLSRVPGVSTLVFLAARVSPTVQLEVESVCPS